MNYEIKYKVLYNSIAALSADLKDMKPYSKSDYQCGQMAAFRHVVRWLDELLED